MTPERMQKILKEHGTDLTLKEAEEAIEFMQMLAKIEVAHYLAEEEQPKTENNPGVNSNKD